MAPEAPRRVLYLTPSVRLLGARRSLLGLVTHLDPVRWQPIVCGQSEGHLAEALRQEGVPFEILHLGWWRKAKYWLRRPWAIARLARLIRRRGIDLVHCNEIYPNPYAVRATARLDRARGRRVPVVTHMRLSISPRMVRNYDLGRADLIIVPSAAAGHDFDLWPDKERRVVVVPNGVDLDEFRRTLSREEARGRLGLPMNGLLLSAIGDVSPRKGGDLVLEALARLGPAIPGLRLMFVGDPHRGQSEFAEGLRRRAAQPPLAGRVHFFPYTRDILPFYEAADVNLLISRDEGFGRTIIEAGALETPSIGARTGGIPELIDHGRTGLLVPPEDPAALAEAISRLAREEPERRAMGRAARERAEAEFSIRAHARRMMDLYDRVVTAA